MQKKPVAADNVPVNSIALWEKENNNQPEQKIKLSAKNTKTKNNLQ